VSLPRVGLNPEPAQHALVRRLQLLAISVAKIAPKLT